MDLILTVYFFRWIRDLITEGDILIPDSGIGIGDIIFFDFLSTCDSFCVALGRRSCCRREPFPCVSR